MGEVGGDEWDDYFLAFKKNFWMHVSLCTGSWLDHSHWGAFAKRLWGASSGSTAGILLNSLLTVALPKQLLKNCVPAVWAGAAPGTVDGKTDGGRGYCLRACGEVCVCVCV